MALPVLAGAETGLPTQPTRLPAGWQNNADPGKVQCSDATHRETTWHSAAYAGDPVSSR